MDNNESYAQQYLKKIEDYLLKLYARKLSKVEAAVEGP